jgi:succinate-semialdehyde dehydrogenase/glutarate-semialdehyde dehydrogenase
MTAFSKMPVGNGYDDLFLFINGKWIEADGRDTSPVINPATGAVVGCVPHATVDDLDRY